MPMDTELRLLLIEGSRTDATSILRQLKGVGYHVAWKRIETEAALLVALHEEIWDIVICAYQLSDWTCEAAFNTVKHTHPNLPFVIVSKFVDEKDILPLIELGASDFISKDRLFRLPWVVQREVRYANERMSMRIILEQSYNATVLAWGTALELRDVGVQGHTLRVANYALEIATRHRLDADVLKDVYYGSLLHDVGKIGIPDSILLKSGKLTPEEWGIMKTHPTIAYNMLRDIPFLETAIDIPYCHHEHWDGSGYPRGLVGKSIPMSARIFALVDVYDALTTDRPYRKALSPGTALGTMRQMAAQFDPLLLKDFIHHSLGQA